MTIQERVYHKLPVLLQNLACSWEGFKLKRLRFDQETLNHAIQSGKLDHDQWCELRDAKLRSFVEHSATTVPYYRRWFQENRIDYRDIQTVSDLSVLPIINKALVKENLRDFLSEAVPQQECKIVRTSGTTGSTLVFPVSLAAQRNQWAVWWRYRTWHGIQPGTWCAQFTNRRIVRADTNQEPFWRYNWPARQILFSVNHTSEENMPSFVEELRRLKPPWIHGIVSSVAFLASYIVAHKVDLGYQPKFVTVGSENLYQHQRKCIDQAFGVRTRMHYGLAEAVANISERPDGGYYVDEDFSAVEFVPHAQGLGCRIVGTNFCNFAFPLLRYDTGDIVSPGDNETRTQYPGRRIESVDGRLYDFIVLADGRHTHTLFGIFQSVDNVLEAQFIQFEAGHAKLLIVPGKEYNQNDESKIRNNVKKNYGQKLTLSFEYVDGIRKTNSGKMKFIRSHCNDTSFALNR